MPLTITATPGDAAANSYATELEAAAYFAGRPGSEAWTSASTETRKAALIGAALRLEQEFYRGTRASAAQALAWPRAGASVDGVEVASTAIPAVVKRAQCEEALALLENPARCSDTGLEGYASVDVGPLSLALRDGQPAGRLTAATLRYLAPVLAGGGGGTFELLRS